MANQSSFHAAPTGKRDNPTSQKSSTSPALFRGNSRLCSHPHANFTILHCFSLQKPAGTQPNVTTFDPADDFLDRVRSVPNILQKISTTKMSSSRWSLSTRSTTPIKIGINGLERIGSPDGEDAMVLEARCACAAAGLEDLYQIVKLSRWLQISAK